MECFSKIVDVLPISNDYFKCIYKMMCCSFCNCQKNNQPVDKWLELLIVPLFVIHRNLSTSKEELMLQKMMGMGFLGKIKDSFPSSEDENGELSKLTDILNDFLSGKETVEQSLNILKEIHEPTYIELLRQQIYIDNYKLALLLIALYFDANITVNSHGFFYNICYRPKSTGQEGISIQIDPFSDQGATIDHSLDPDSIILSFGRSLDEGCTEHITQQMLETSFSTPKDDIADSVYYTEVRFIKKVESIVGKNSLMQAYFNSNLSVFYNLVKNTNNPCDFFHLYYYTDNQEWGAAMEILKRVKESLT